MMAPGAVVGAAAGTEARDWFYLSKFCARGGGAPGEGSLQDGCTKCGDRLL
jgi:hypothetical protein